MKIFEKYMVVNSVIYCQKFYISNCYKKYAPLDVIATSFFLIIKVFKIENREEINVKKKIFEMVNEIFKTEWDTIRSIEFKMLISINFNFFRQDCYNSIKSGTLSEKVLDNVYQHSVLYLFFEPKEISSAVISLVFNLKITTPDILDLMKYIKNLYKISPF